MERLGFGWERLSKINPRIIAASVKGFGSTGPYAGYKSFEWIAQAMGGPMGMTGSPDGPPVRTAGGLGDTGAGLHCAIGILAALVQRSATGVGQQVEVAQQDAVLNLHRIHLREHYVAGKPAPRLGNRSRATAPSNLFRCRPGGPNDYVFIHVANNEMWKALAKAIGRPELGEDSTLANHRERLARVEEIDGIVEAWTEKQGKHEVMEILGAAGVPCGAVLDSGEILSNEHLIGRGMVVEMEHPTRGRFPMPGNPVRLSGSSTELTPAPLLGQHSAEIYGELCGIGADELEKLKEEGVV
jgi:formyl-CoA transferase